MLKFVLVIATMLLITGSVKAGETKALIHNNELVKLAKYDTKVMTYNVKNITIEKINFSLTTKN